MKTRDFCVGIFGVLIGILAGVVERPSILFVGSCALLTGIVIIIGAAIPNSWTTCLYIGCVGLVIGLLRGSTSLQEVPREFVPLFDTTIEKTGTVVELPDIRETGTRLVVEIEEGTARTRIIASASSFPARHVGDVVQVSGKLTRPKPFETDGGRTFAYDSFLAKDGIFGIVQPASVTFRETSDSWWLAFLRTLESARTAFTRAIESVLPEPESALAVGILIGGKQGLGKRLLEAFTASGMLQIVVLSGYNVMIVAEGILGMLKGLPKKLSSSIALVSIAAFVLLAGAGSSAVRAGIMAAFALFARATERTYDVMRVLLIALMLMALINPLGLAYDPGLQFSFLATAGLVLISPLIARQMRFIRSMVLRELLSTTLAAQAGVLPILLWQTGNLSIVSVLSNMLSMPVIPFAMGGAAIAAVASLILGSVMPFAPVMIALPAYAALWFVIHIATVSAMLPYANVILPKFSFALMLVTYAIIGIVVVRETKRAIGPPGPIARSESEYVGATSPHRAGGARPHPN